MSQTVCLYKETYLKDLGDALEDERLQLYLPLPAIEKSVIERLTQDDQEYDEEDADDAYNSDHIATSSGFFYRSIREKGISTIGWRVLQHQRVIELDVCDLTCNNSHDLRTIRINSPMKVRENCLCVSEDTRMNLIVVDFITESGFLYTTSFHVEHFFKNTSLTPLSEENAASWRSIKQPVNFDINGSLVMKAVSFDCLVVSLISGQMVMLTREACLDPIYCINFKDNYAPGRLGLAKKWFGTFDRVSGYPGLSARAPVSVAISPDEQFIVTLSLNRYMKVWSLIDFTVVSEVILGSSEDKSLLSPRSMKALEFGCRVMDGTSPSSTASPEPGPDPDDSVAVKPLSKSYFVSYLPTLESKFKIWRYDPSLANSQDPESSVLSDLGPNFEIDPEQPEDGDLWTISDFRLVVSSDALQLWVVWKNDKISALRTITIPLTSQQQSHRNHHTWVTTDSSQTPFSDYVVFADTTSEGETEHFLQRIFGPDGFSLKTIETAVKIYSARNAELDEEFSEFSNAYQRTDNLDMQLLKDKVTKLVGAGVDMDDRSRSALKSSDQSGTGAKYDVNISEHSLYRNDLEVQWTRFTKLCEEIERPCHEFSSLGYDSVTNVVYVMKASFVAMVRPCTATELYYYNRSSSPTKQATRIISRLTGRNSSDVHSILRTLDCISIFRQLLSHQIKYNLYLDLLDDVVGAKRHRHLTSERMSSIFETNLDYITDADLLSFGKALQRIGNLDTILQHIYEDYLGDKELLAKYNALTQASAAAAKETHPSSKGVHALSNGLYQFCCINRLITLDILIVCLLSTISDQFVGDFVSRFSDYTQILKVNDATVSALSVSTNERQDFFNRFLDKQDWLRLSPTLDIGMGTYIAIYNIWQALGSPQGLENVAVEMSVAGLQEEAVEFCNLYLGSDNFPTLVKAHISLLAGEPNSLYMIRDCAIELSTPVEQFQDNDYENIDVELLSKLNPVYKSFGMLRHGLMSYYYGMAQICYNVQNYDFSLKLAQYSVQQDPEDDVHKTVAVNKLLFNAALSCQDFDQAYDSLMELHYTGELSKAEEYQVLDSLMSTMVAAGKGTRFCSYPFIGLSESIEYILETKVNNGSPSDIESKSYYQLTYVWKLDHGDLRGAAEAHYGQLRKLLDLSQESSWTEREAFSQDIIQLYLSVLNVLECMDSEDQWILHQSPGLPRKALFHKDVKAEYDWYRKETGGYIVKGE